MARGVAHHILACPRSDRNWRDPPAARSAARAPRPLRDRGGREPAAADDAPAPATDFRNALRSMMVPPRAVAPSPSGQVPCRPAAKHGMAQQRPDRISNYRDNNRVFSEFPAISATARANSRCDSGAVRANSLCGRKGNQLTRTGNLIALNNECVRVRTANSGIRNADWFRGTGRLVSVVTEDPCIGRPKRLQRET